MATVYRPNGTTSAAGSQPSLNSFGSGSSLNTHYSSASCSSARSHYPACPRCEAYPHRYEADCSPDGRRPLRRDAHVTSPPGQHLRGRWEVDTSGGSSDIPPPSHKALKVLCGEGADLQLETRGKGQLEARIQITGRGWVHPQIEVVTEYGDGVIEMTRRSSQRFRLTARTLGGNVIVRIPADFSGKVVTCLPGSVTFSASAAKLLSGPRTTTVGATGSAVAEYSTPAPSTDTKPARLPDAVRIFPGEGSFKVLVGDEVLIRANGLVAGVLGAKHWAEGELTRRRSTSRRV